MVGKSLTNMKAATRQILLDLQEAFDFHRNPFVAAPMAKYMKDKFEYIGLPQPVRKSLAADFLKAAAKLDTTEILALTKALWKLKEREYQYTALDLLLKTKKKWDPDCLQIFLELVTRKSWWDTVDALATRMIGGYYAGQPLPDTMVQWVASDNIWQNRTALLFQMHYKENTDTAFLSDAILRLREKNDFFIQKAIGWALRQYHRTNPAWVEAMVENAALRGIAKREALKHA